MIKIIEKDGKINEYDKSNQYAIDTLRHTCSHILAQAFKRLYNSVMLGTGLSVENGFYYDIDFSDTIISDTDLSKIEKEMVKMVKEKLILLYTINYKFSI